MQDGIREIPASALKIFYRQFWHLSDYQNVPVFDVLKYCTLGQLPSEGQT